MVTKGIIYFLFGGWMYLFQRPREADRDRGDTRDRTKSLVRQVNEAEEMVKEARDKENIVRAKAIIGINDDMNKLG